MAGSDARCVEVVELFFGFLGSVAGNLALTLGARGGVYVGGGIVPRLGDWIDRSTFRERFVAKGRFRDYLDGIPDVADPGRDVAGADRGGERAGPALMRDVPRLLLDPAAARRMIRKETCPCARSA